MKKRENKHSAVSKQLDLLAESRTLIADSLNTGGSKCSKT